MPKLDEKETLYIRAMNKALRVTAIFNDDAEANAYMERQTGTMREGVVAVFGKGETQRIYIARLNDHGVKIQEKP